VSNKERPAPDRLSRSTVGVFAMTRGFVMVVVAGILIGEAASAEEYVPNLKDPKMIAAGHDLFLAKQCAHCHGADGRGGIDLTQRELYPKDIFQSIADGREKKGLRMPAWRDVLTDEEIWQATAYVISISRQQK
jgi:mono/diheme cytochrome c family protein